MKTSRNFLLVSAVVMAIVMSSCRIITCEGPDCDDFANVERTDIAVTGDLEIESFVINDDRSGVTDLVDYTFYGFDAEQFDFIVQLNGNYQLTISMYDAQRLNPWLQVDLPYNIYPGQDLEDKLYYTNILLHDDQGNCLYSTNSDDNIPPGIFIDVFKIIQSQDGFAQCRIRDMVLYRTDNPDRTISINGTFIGKVDV